MKDSQAVTALEQKIQALHASRIASLPREEKLPQALARLEEIKHLRITVAAKAQKFAEADLILSQEAHIVQQAIDAFQTEVKEAHIVPGFGEWLSQIS